jgi:hypothetical protein
LLNLKEEKMPRTKDGNVTKFEFVLRLNDNIVVQRFFNVKDYNKNTLRSVELLDEVNSFVSGLQESLKKRTFHYMLDNSNFYYSGKSEEDEDIENENFTFSIRKDDRDVIVSQFSAGVYPPKVRYTVDIRPQLRKVLKDFTDTLSEKNPTTNYRGYAL